MPAVDLTIIGKPECHLCDVAADVIDQVVSELADAEPARLVRVRKLSILDDAALHERYWEQIPVIWINGEEHAYWRVEPTRLRDALLAATPN